MVSLGGRPGRTGDCRHRAGRGADRIAPPPLSVLLPQLALGVAARRDYRGAWAMLILLTPIGMLAVNPLGAVLDDPGPGQAMPPAWSSMVVASVLVATIGPMLLPLALVARGRLSAGHRPPGTDRGHCPTCGAPSPNAQFVAGHPLIWPGNRC
jgi:hypothetical protein